MQNVERLRDQQQADRNPGHALGQFLLSHTNSAEYLVSQLEAYLEAAKADLQAKKKFATRMLAALSSRKGESGG